MKGKQQLKENIYFDRSAEWFGLGFLTICDKLINKIPICLTICPKASPLKS